ncbi:MAG: hypothetical protein FWH12_02600 [Treponema sp.]|nr:hypothetical protein [Treponema sp.]
MDVKKIFEKQKDQNTFIKVTAKPAIEGTQKAALNRKGNLLFNSGDIEGARRIFLTTGYSDGLSRVGDYYQSKGRSLDALKMYWLAPNRGKAEPILEKLSLVISTLIRDDGSDHNE